MSASKRFLPPEAVKRAQRLELKARQIVEGFLSGAHRSPYFGQSVEFVQHRQYLPGDDVRHIDWKVWARQDKLVIKQYEEDTNLRCSLLVDGSRSMSYGQADQCKFEFACTLAACLAMLVLRQQDAAGCMVFDHKIRSRVPLRSSQAHLLDILGTLDNAKPTDKTDLELVIKDVVQSSPRRGLMILLSDLLGVQDSALKAINLLRKAGHDIMVLHVMHDDELDFPFSDPTRFEGLESDMNLTCNPRALRDGYLQSLERFLEKVRHSCAAARCDYLLVRTSDAPGAVLAKVLSERIHAVRQ